MAPDTAEATRGSLTSRDGTRLAYRAWPLGGAPITFAVVHGHGEHSGRYERFARGMAAHGMATYAVDLRGHGESSGQRGHLDSWSQWVEDAAAFVGLVEKEARGEVVPLGHSFGGVVMLTTVRSGQLQRARRFIVSNPALRLKKPVSWLLDGTTKALSTIAPRLTLSNGVDARTVSRIPEIVQAYRTDPLVHNKITPRLYVEWRRAAKENLAKAGEIRLPFLILTGTDDPLIDPDSSRELHRNAPEMSELRELEGRYHEPFNDLGSEEVFEVIAKWLQK